MQWLGYSEEEIEQTTANLASDWYDRRVDQDLEDKHNSQTKEQA